MQNRVILKHGFWQLKSLSALQLIFAINFQKEREYILIERLVSWKKWGAQPSPVAHFQAEISRASRRDASFCGWGSEEVFDRPL